MYYPRVVTSYSRVLAATSVQCYLRRLVEYLETILNWARLTVSGLTIMLQTPSEGYEVGQPSDLLHGGTLKLAKIK
jgi:hypothetical protein